MTHVITGRNVNELFPLGIDHLTVEGAWENSRAGQVLVAPTPVVSVYERPRERVLFSARRDANPFFHLFESLWMLAGRSDAASLDHYVRDFGARFAESDGEIHGAYGRRWRVGLGRDQLDLVVDKLRTDPTSRQAVIQMWDSSLDLVGEWRDRPCNTHVYLRLRDVGAAPDHDGRDYVLDLTVCCRSNDAIWGAYGANAVHFSFLQEYLAGRIGVGVGRMYQVSNNFHVYASALQKNNLANVVGLLEEPDLYETYDVSSFPVPLPVGTEWSSWDADLRRFMAWHDRMWSSPTSRTNRTPLYVNEWFGLVAAPICEANYHRRNGGLVTAQAVCHEIAAQDWRFACSEYLRRRIER